jgi:hypothetical protein
LKQPLQPSQPPDWLSVQSLNGTNSADDLYNLALSLLDSLTAHSPLPPPTPYSIHLAPNATGIDRLQARLEGTVTGSVLQRVRTVAGAVASTSSHLLGRKPAHRKETTTTTVQFLIERLKYAIEHLGATSSRRTSGRTPATGEGGGEGGGGAATPGWKEKLQASALRGDVVLTPDELREAWREVIKIAGEAAAAGSSDALLLLGDLYLVSSPRFPTHAGMARKLKLCPSLPR